MKTPIEQAETQIRMAKKQEKLNPQTEQNQKRLAEYRRRMVHWILAYGITHRACELRYFGTTSYTDLKKKIRQK